MNDARAGMHNGPWHDTREKRTRSPASRSRLGVSTPASPAQPIMSARCWSAITSTMFGAVGIRQFKRREPGSMASAITVDGNRLIPGALEAEVDRVDAGAAELPCDPGAVESSEGRRVVVDRDRRVFVRDEAGEARVAAAGGVEEPVDVEGVGIDPPQRRPFAGGPVDAVVDRRPHHRARSRPPEVVAAAEGELPAGDGEDVVAGS